MIYTQLQTVLLRVFYVSDPPSCPSVEPCIGPEGMERLCNDIEVDPEDIVMLALAWKLHAAEMGYFKRSEWLTGMMELE